MNSLGEARNDSSSDLGKTWPLFVFGIALTFLACLFFQFILRWAAGFVVWASIIAGVILFGCGNDSNSVLLTQIIFAFLLLAVFPTFVNADTSLAIIPVIMVVILIILLVLARHKIAISIEIIKEGSK